MFFNFLLPKEIKEIFVSLDQIPNMLRSSCVNLRTNNSKISDFCSSYNMLWAPSHYENLFIAFDLHLETCCSLLKNIAKKSILNDKQAVIIMLKEEKQSSREYSTLLIISLCEHFLGSGREHIYREVLSPAGYTFALIHHMLLNYSEQESFLTSQQRKKIVEHTNGLLKNVG